MLLYKCGTSIGLMEAPSRVTSVRIEQDFKAHFTQSISGFTHSAGDLFADSRWAGGWKVCVRYTDATDAERTQTQHAALFGAVRWKGTACPFPSDCHPICGTDPHPPVFSGQDQMLVGVSGHMSADIRCSIESNEWSDWVCLKNLQEDLNGLSLWKGP